MTNNKKRVLIWVIVLWIIMLVSLWYTTPRNKLSEITPQLSWDIYSWYVTQEKYDELLWWYNQQSLEIDWQYNTIMTLQSENDTLRKDIEIFVSCPKKWKEVYVLEYRDEDTPSITTWIVVSCARELIYVDSDWDGYWLGYREVYNNKKELLNSL